MAAILTTVGDAIVTALTAGVAADAFSQDFTPVRSYLTDEDLADFTAGTRRVDVIRVDSKSIRAARDSFARRCSFDISLRNKYDVIDRTSGDLKTASIDEDVELLEEIEDYLSDPTRQRLELSGAGEAVFVPLREGDEDDKNLGIRVNAVSDYLRTPGMYIGVVRVRYDVGLRWVE